MGYQQSVSQLNSGASKTLIASAVCYGIGFFLPAIDVDVYWTTEHFYFWDVLSGFGILLILASLALVIIGAKKTKTGISVKRYAWGSLITMFIVIGAVFDTMFDLDYYVGYDVTLPGNGVMLILLGMILAFIGGISSKRLIYHQPAFQQPIYQKQQYQQNQYQQPAYQHSQAQIQQPQVQQQPVDQQQNNQPKVATSNQGSKFCSNCGSKGSDESQYCNQCGESII